jgi:hypothetical protein
MTRSPLACVLAASFGLALAAPGSALELSDVKLDFTDTGVDPGGAAGSLRLRAQGGEATLQIRLRGVDADPVHLCAGPDEANLLHRAELAPSGGTLSSGGELDFDPRGKVLAVANAEDCSEASLLLTAEVGEGQCTSGEKGVKIHERAGLETGSATDPASAELLYHLLPDRNCKFAGGGQGQPRRKARLSVRVKHADPGAGYDVCIDDVDRGDLTTNAAGVGRADFTFNRPRGNGQGNPKRSVIDFDAYASTVEIRNDGEDCGLDDDTAVFFGSLLAPLCAEQDLASVTLAPPVADPTVTGGASLERSEGCARVFEVRVEGLAANTAYDVDVDPGNATLEGSAVLVTDATGAGEVVFSTDPGSGEELLDFDPSGQLVEVREAGTANVVLSGTLP